MGMFGRFIRHMDLMSEMFRRTGAFAEPMAAANEEMSLKNAVFACQSCKQDEACRNWLDDATQGSAPPAFCANAALIGRLRSAATPEALAG